MNRYDILGVKPDATDDEIKKAYRKLASKTHPDIGGAVMAPLFMSVQNAYETLSDPVKRAAHDRELEGPASTPPAADPSPQTFRASPPAPAPAPVPPTKRDIVTRRIKIGVVAALLVGFSGWWLFNEIVLWQLIQPKDGLRLVTFPGLPAIVYAVLWAFGALVAAVADDLGTAFRVPLGCAAIAAGFAFITATGTPGVWMPALVAGFALTFAIALTVRLWDDLVDWVG
jgi:hypothetical protein